MSIHIIMSVPQLQFRVLLVYGLQVNKSLQPLSDTFVSADSPPRLFMPASTEERIAGCSIERRGWCVDGRAWGCAVSWPGGAAMGSCGDFRDRPSAIGTSDDGGVERVV